MEISKKEKFRKKLESVYGKVSDDKFERVWRNTEIIVNDKITYGNQFEVTAKNEYEKVLH